jgi:integrase/recombinase XerD
VLFRVKVVEVRRPNVKLSYLSQLFLDSRKRGTGGAKRKCSKATLEIYDRNIKIFSQYLLEYHQVVDYTEIKRLHTMQFLDWLDEREKKGEWKRATTLQTLRTLKTLFLFVEKDEDCQSEGLKSYAKWLPSIEKAPRRTDIPQMKDLKAFKNSFNTKNRWQFRDYVVTCLLLDTGVRIGEVCNLQIEHVLLDDHLMIVTGKTGTRPIPLTDQMVRLLRAWLKRRSSCVTAQESPYVFISKYRPRMDKDAFGNRFRKHCSQHKLPRITAHSMRHSFCTHFLKQGGDMEKLRSITGHSTYEMLKDYLHLAKVGGSAVREELERVSMLKDI